MLSLEVGGVGLDGRAVGGGVLRLQDLLDVRLVLQHHHPLAPDPHPQHGPVLVVQRVQKPVKLLDRVVGCKVDKESVFSLSNNQKLKLLGLTKEF